MLGLVLSQNSGTASQNQPLDIPQWPQSRKHLYGIWPFTTFVILAAWLFINLRGEKLPCKASDLKTRCPAADLAGQAVRRSKKPAAPKCGAETSTTILKTLLTRMIATPLCGSRSIHWSNHTNEALNTDAHQLMRCDLTGSFGFTTLRHSYMVVGFERNQHTSHKNDWYWKEIVDTSEWKMYRQTTAQKPQASFMPSMP